jgi:hypothetical protein
MRVSVGQRCPKEEVLSPPLYSPVADGFLVRSYTDDLRWLTGTFSIAAQKGTIWESKFISALIARQLYGSLRHQE